MSLTHLLANDIPFDSTLDCLKAFEQLKKVPTTTPIIHMPDWRFPLKLMCDISDFPIDKVSDNTSRNRLM